MHRFMLSALSLGSLAAALLAGCTQEPAPPQPVSFQEDVQPILEANCSECHSGGGAGAEASGLDMSSYEGLMEGTRYGPVIEPGDSVSSTLVLLLEGKADPSIRMPHGKDPLSDEKIAVIKRWIDQGAPNN